MKKKLWINLSAKHLMNSLKNIKKYLKINKIDVCLISKNNQYLNEFIEPRENFLQKISKFSGSLGYALISHNKQILYVDGRYTQQAKIQSKIFSTKVRTFRSGKINEWNKYLSENHKDKIKNKAGNWLIENDYEKNNDCFFKISLEHYLWFGENGNVEN